MILPDDDIEEARYRAMKALGYKVCSITKPATVSEKIPDSYNWIAEAMEGRAKVPALDMEKIRKRREKKKKKES